MDFFQTQSKTSFNIDLFMKNYSGQSLKICGN